MQKLDDETHARSFISSSGYFVISIGLFHETVRAFEWRLF
jgi:hypothetical protein